MGLEHDPAIRDRVTRLMGVLRQLAAARYRPVRSTSSYHSMAWLAQAQQSCTVRSPGGPGDELLRVSRVVQEPEPPMPGILRGWMRRPEDDLAEPVCLDVRHFPGDRRMTLDEAPGVREAFDSWMQSWRLWAEQERLRRPRRKVFDALFDMHRLAADQPESVELVVACGLLQTRGDEDAAVRVHMVTQAARIVQDLETGDMVCTLAEESALRLEDDELLSGLPGFDLSGSAILRDKLLDAAASPVDPAMPEFLKDWATRVLTMPHKVVDTWDEVRSDETLVTTSPAIVARPRGAFAIRAFYDAIARSLADETQPVPLGLAQLVEAIEPQDRVAWLQRTGALSSVEVEPPLFPLPANEEQAQIIDRLGHDSGVVVEGPPGTGKTHTIANLVSALLARGQRVLVTSEKAQALRVLRDKLPPEMQELCVSLTDSSAKGDSDLSRSVATLAGRKTDFNAVRADREIDDLAQRRDEVRRTRAALLEEIRAVREEETYQHPEIAPGYSGTLAQIASRLVETEADDGWLGLGATGEVPLTTHELDELLGLLAADTDERRARRNQRLPDPAQVMASVRFAELARLVAAGETARGGDGAETVEVLERLPVESLARLDPACREADEALGALRDLRAHQEWARELTSSLLGGAGPYVWQQAYERLELVDGALAHHQAVGHAQVGVTAPLDVGRAAAVFENLAAYLEAGGSLRKMFKSAEQKAAAEFDAVVVVGGAPVGAAAEAHAAAHHLRVVEIVQWVNSAFAPLGTGIDPWQQRVVVVDQLVQLRQAGQVVRRVLAAVEAMRELLLAVPPARRPVLRDIEAVEALTAMAIRVTHARVAALARTGWTAHASSWKPRYRLRSARRRWLMCSTRSVAPIRPPTTRR